MNSITLKDGSLFPAFGLGTWLSKPGEVYDAVRKAIEVGYTHIDGAAIYQNEAEVGKAINDAIKAGDIAREHLWVTSKLWNDAHLAGDVRPAIEKTLKDLQLDYLDLYLIHWPVAVKPGVGIAREREDFLTPEQAPLKKTWEALCQLRDDELTRHVGVSNMGEQRVTELGSVAYTPEVVQVESHPHLPQWDLLNFCKEEAIGFTAYSPLGSPQRTMKKENEPTLLDAPVILEVAQKHSVTPGQILIAWALNRGTSVIPKSTNMTRLQQNIDATKILLDDEDLAKIATLNNGYRYVDGSFFCHENSPYKIEDLFL